MVPTSTIDLACATGAEIPIEERPASEVTSLGGVNTAPAGCPVYNPAFDVTPHRCVRTSLHVSALSVTDGPFESDSRAFSKKRLFHQMV